MFTNFASYGAPPCIKWNVCLLFVFQKGFEVVSCKYKYETNLNGWNLMRFDLPRVAIFTEQPHMRRIYFVGVFILLKM